MKETVLKPPAWNCHEPHGFVWGRVVPTGARTIYVSGQTSVDDDGNPLHKGDTASQLLRSVSNLEAVLAEADANLSHVVKMTYFTVDVDLFFAHMNVLVDRLAQGGCKPISTLVEVKRLFHPDILFEVESVTVV